MKDLKMKDLVLEHYRKVYEAVMDGITVRVFKPKTMGKLPTYAMGTVLHSYARDAACMGVMERDRKVQWWLGNPDYGAWDAQIVKRFDPRKRTLDIYFTALLIRPFSRQAYDWYGAHMMTSDAIARLMLMWDSREFDRSGCYDTTYGAYGNQQHFDKYLYSGKKFDGYDPIDDPTFDPCNSADDIPQQGFVLKFRHKDGNIETETSSSLSQELVTKMEKYLKPTLKNFIEFTKEHPDVPEMHYYTDLTIWEKDLEGE